MNISFQTKNPNVEARIVCERPLTEAEAKKIIDSHIKSKRELLFQAWLSVQDNKDWRGDEEIKKDELWDIHFSSSNNELFIDAQAAEAALAGDRAHL